MKYNIERLIREFELGKDLDFLFFWGHTEKLDGKISKQCLSQWFNASFLFDGVKYKTAEHWMMAQKALLFNEKHSFDKIVKSHTPKEAKALGRKVKNFGPDVWNDHKYQIVVAGNLHKFTQNTELFNYLKGTQERYLLEASPVDKVWGIGVSEDSEEADNPYAWTGENLLGFALMEVRDKISKIDKFEFLKDPFLPPWKKYPKIDCSDMFFRMGGGESYAIDFWTWFDALSSTEKEVFKITFPPKNGWENAIEKSSV